MFFMCAYVHVCVCIHRTAVISCMLFYTLLGTSSSQSHEQQHIPISPNAAYENINKVNTNINPTYGEMRETTRQQHVTYEEITM